MKYVAILLGLVAAQIGLVWTQHYVTIKFVDELFDEKKINPAD